MIHKTIVVTIGLALVLIAVTSVVPISHEAYGICSGGIPLTSGCPGNSVGNGGSGSGGTTGGIMGSAGIGGSGSGGFTGGDGSAGTGGSGAGGTTNLPGSQGHGGNSIGAGGA